MAISLKIIVYHINIINSDNAGCAYGPINGCLFLCGQVILRMHGFDWTLAKWNSQLMVDMLHINESRRRNGWTY